MNKDFPYRLYLVTDQALCLGRDFFWVVEEGLKGGVDIVQLREKDLDMESFSRKAERLKALCDRYKVPLVINDDVHVAKSIDAAALHVGQSDSPISDARGVLGEDFPIGLSLDKISDLEKPKSKLAWYFGVSPIYSTPTKTDTQYEWGLEGLQDLRKKTHKKLVAIGRVKVENAAEMIQSGADCLAVVSGICSAPSPAHAAEAFREAIEKGLSKRI
ncbi:thiamine phosphate synthase [Arthrospiribacter ruber]|uniref:Thiamine-phosphate synthase n=1 Tax=Arthrospiribacter ruber TaxID=2487934 RepID=A0A951MH02_9BACT|nr:thiamine phosphate synthase [Arthrospiribacter ruber]MBW3469705.1 thiamine phosphate synthase [Arthrospiribacter ruber]